MSAGADELREDGGASPAVRVVVAGLIVLAAVVVATRPVRGPAAATA